jgi:hypothetical protein
MEVFVSAIRQNIETTFIAQSSSIGRAFGINRIHFTEKNEMKHPKIV